MELLETTWRKILAGEPNAVLFFSGFLLITGYVLYTLVRKRRGLRPGHEEREPLL
jgi:hypothetical protein